MSHPKLAWLSEFSSSLSLALNTPINITVEDHVDPLKKIVHLELGEDLRKDDFNPIQRMAHTFSEANDCVIQKIKKGPKKLIMEVLVKSRLGPTMCKNPLKEG